MEQQLTCETYEALKKGFFQGWKTWNVNSVLSHVHMPDGLSLNLGIKEYREGRYLREALIGQFPDETGLWPKEVLFPGDHAMDDSYTSIRVCWCDLEYRVESAQDEDAFYLLVTPVRTQKKPAMLVLETGFMWNRPGRVYVQGDAIRAESPEGTYLVRTSAPLFTEDPNIPVCSPYLAVRTDEPVAFYVQKMPVGDADAGKAHREQSDAPSGLGEMTLFSIQEIVREKERVLHERHAAFGGQAWQFQAMECAIAWDTVYDAKHDRAISPVSRLWSIRNGGYVLFCWDTYFAAYIAAACGCRELAYSNLISITEERTGNGFVPNLAYGTGQKSEDRSQPPVGSAMLLGIYRKYREPWIVALLYPTLLGWNTWFWNNRRSPSGAFCWGSDPIPVLYGNRWESDGVHDTFGAALESGLDNSPMYDDIPFNKRTNRMELEDVGLTGLYILDCEALIELSKLLGEETDIAELSRRKAAAEKGLQGLWNEQTGFFHNRRTDTGDFSSRLSPTNFYALYADGIDPARLRRVIGEHYFNPDEFYGEWMLPAIARCDPAFADQDYWRGRVWAPMNFLVYLGLLKQNCREASADLAEKSAHIFSKEWNEHRHVHENYNAVTGEGCDVDNSDKFYHWGALMAVIGLMEAGALEDLKIF